jgi:outer membrane protein OmpA-like peptidoglycan-associated protein
MKFLLACLLCCVTGNCIAQTYDPERVNAKAVKLYEKALDMLRDDQVAGSIPVLMQSVAADTNFVDAYLSLGGALGELKKYDQSVRMYEKARSKDTAYFRMYNLPYSINLAGQGKFAEALEAVNLFLAHPRLNDRSLKSGLYRKRSYEFALAWAAAHANNNFVFQPLNLGDSINTARPEYYPSVTVTDSVLVFTRKTTPGREDFVQSNMQGKSFGKSKLIDGDINLETNKGALSVSQDGEWMVFAGMFPTEAHQSMDIYISYYTPQGWSEPSRMGGGINTDFYESGPTLSPDKNALYFCSNRPDGYGGLDLYVSYRQPNGRWGNAINMGPDINSAGDEQAPFMHADNQTLYYTSSGLPGYGGSDLFLIRKNGKGEWGKPENLGYPINTIENEGSMAVSADGLTAYYASDRADTRGSLDIYKFELRSDIRPFRTLYVKGTVIDKNTGKPIPSSVELTDNATNMPLMKVQTDELGAYFITLPTGHDYTFTVNRKGYLFYSDLYELSGEHADSVYKKDIYLQPVALHAAITFRNIQFANNSYEIPSAGFIELEKLRQVLTENPTLKVEISGHTDNIGKPEDNQALSTNRAKAIVDWLVRNGVDANRLSYKGFGATQPVTSNDTEAGRAQNRRTAFTVTAL